MSRSRSPSKENLNTEAAQAVDKTTEQLEATSLDEAGDKPEVESEQTLHVVHAPANEQEDESNKNEATVAEIPAEITEAAPVDTTETPAVVADKENLTLSGNPNSVFVHRVPSPTPAVPTPEVESPRP
jgi:hypothetical protein